MNTQKSHLRLVVSNPPPVAKPRPFRSSPFLHAVPAHDNSIRATVRRFSDFLLKDDRGDPAAYLRTRRKFDTSVIVGAIQCLSPKAATLLQADLTVIATLSLHPSIRRAAVMKLAESELS